MTNNNPPVAQFHAALDSAISRLAFAMLPGYDSDELILDGRFSLDQLRAIVAAWEEYQKIVPPHAGQAE